MGVRVERKDAFIRPTRAAMRSHGSRQAGQRIDPSRARGRPWGLMDPGKQGYGRLPWPAVVRPCGPMNARMQAQGRLLSPDAGTHGTSWPQGSDGRVNPSGPRLVAMGSDRFGEATRRVHPFAGRGRPCALIDVGIGPEGRGDPRRRARASGSSNPASAGGPHPSPRGSARFARASAGIRREGSSRVRGRVRASGRRVYA